MKEIKLGNYSTTALITILIITKVLISAPSLYARHSLGAGWLEVLISGLFEMLVLAVLLKLVLNFDGMDIIDIAQHAFGKIGKIITGTGSIVIISISTAAVFRSFEELIRNTVMHGESYEGISVFLLSVGIIAAYLGLSCQAGLNGIITPFVFVIIFLVLLIGVSRYSISNIQPIFGHGITNVISNALLKNSSYFELGILLFIMPYLKEKSSVKRIGFTALGVSITVFTVVTLAYQLSVPYEAAGTFAIPMYQMTRMINAKSFFQRIEPLNTFLWSGAMFVYVGAGIWLSSQIFKKTFSLGDYKPLIYIFAEIICLMALIPGSETSVEKIYDFLMTYSYIAYPIIPIALLTTAQMTSFLKPR